MTRGQRITLVGWAAAWALGEWLLGPPLAIASGLALPWLGFALAALSQTLRP